MNQLKEDERELVKLANYFRKKAGKLIEEGKLSEEHYQVVDACEKLTQTIYDHANFREEVLQKRDTIKTSIKDNPSCPKCNSNTHLKLVGSAKNEAGWKFNKYKCRKCNIEFVWNKPNNPWDMIAFIEKMIQEVQNKVSEQAGQEEKEESEHMINNLRGNLDLVRPIIEQSDREFEAMQQKDTEIAVMIKDFKNYLLIQKVLVDSIN